MKGRVELDFLSRGFILTKKFYPLMMIPIVFDILQLGDILRRAHGFHLKLTVPSAIPSLTQILAESQNQSNGGFTVNLPFNFAGGAFAIVLLILFMLASAFLKGGFLGSILAGVHGKRVNSDIFISSAKTYFSRFLLQYVIIFLFISALVPIVLIFGPLAFLLLIGILVLFFYLLFWDYILVVENENLLDAAKISIKLIHNNLGKVLSFILPIVIITAILGIIVNAIVAYSMIIALIAIVIYAYFGTAVIFAMMSFYLESLRYGEW